MLDLFFRCLDESTAHCLRSGESPVSEMGMGRSHGVDNLSGGSTEANNVTGTIALDNSQPWQDPSPELIAPNDWYGLFNFTDDYTEVLGTSQQPDSLNLQSLEFLYRFL